MASLLTGTLNTRAILPDSLRYLRSDVPMRLTEQDIRWLMENNVHTVIDLRTAEERSRKPCCLAQNPAFDYRPMPVTGGDRIPASPAAVPISYLAMVDEAMGRIIRTIENAQTPVLYCCNAGKDRTGVVSALLLKRLGFDAEFIIRDYLLSAAHLQPLLEAFHQSDPTIDLQVITPQRSYMEGFLAGSDEAMRNIGLSR